MKKILSFLFVGMLISTTAFSQMNTGSFFVSANTSFDLGFSIVNDIDNNEKTTVLKYSFNPKVGYFIKNRLAVGGGLDFESRPTVNEYGEAARLSRLVVGPMARYYMQYGTLIPFGEASFGIGYNNDIPTGVDAIKSKHNVIATTMGIGTDFFLNEKIAIEVMAKYYYEKQKPIFEDFTPQPGYGNGHSISGIAVFFGIVIFFESI